MPLPKILKDLLNLPTAAFVESHVLTYIKDTCRGLKGVTCRPDRYGNLLVRYRHRPRGTTPLVFAAHTDHPGFVAQEMRDRRTVRAAFRGGVMSSYVDGAKVRFWSGDHWVKGKVLELTKTTPVPRFGPGASRPDEALLRVSEPIARNAPGMWDLPAPALKGDRVHACACDDIAGVAALLDLLQRLSKKQLRADVYCLFTRAEEVGFIGAIGAAQVHSIPKKLPVIVIEMSKELPNARIGDGPVLRVGDRLSIFTPELIAFCGDVAQKLSRRRRTFAFQRKLMDGGACESTAFMTYGYQTMCLCLPLGNYHNMDTDRGKIANEYISVSDWRNLSHWFEALVTDEAGYGGGGESPLQKDFDRSLKSYQSLFNGASGGTPARRK